MHKALRPLRLFLVLSAMCMATAFHSDAFADNGAVSAWHDAEHSRIRLIAATGVPYEGQHVQAAGLQFELEGGWKTYWRTPGDGLAPSIEWSTSENVGDAQILWPAPKRLDDPSGIVAYGYENALTLPILLRPKDAGKPMRLALQLVYGVCADLCIPVEADIALEIPAGEDTAQSAILGEALQKVPLQQTRATACPHRFVGGKFKTIEGKPAFAIETAYQPSASGLDLFAEQADGLTIPAAVRQQQASEGRSIYRIQFDATEDVEPLKGDTLTLTMTSDQGSCETSWRVE